MSQYSADTGSTVHRRKGAVNLPGFSTRVLVPDLITEERASTYTFAAPRTGLATKKRINSNNMSLFRGAGRHCTRIPSDV